MEGRTRVLQEKRKSWLASGPPAGRVRIWCYMAAIQRESSAPVSQLYGQRCEQARKRPSDPESARATRASSEAHGVEACPCLSWPSTTAIGKTHVCAVGPDIQKLCLHERIQHDSAHRPVDP